MVNNCQVITQGFKLDAKYSQCWIFPTLCPRLASLYSKHRRSKYNARELFEHLINQTSRYNWWSVPEFAPFLLGDLKFKEGQNNFCFCWKISFNPPQYVVGTPNLCLKMPGTMKQESDQSDHPALRKRLKCGPIMLVYADVQIFQ